MMDAATKKKQKLHGTYTSLQLQKSPGTQLSRACFGALVRDAPPISQS
jgi:hypothetical protein